MPRHPPEAVDDDSESSVILGDQGGPIAPKRHSNHPGPKSDSATTRQLGGPRYAVTVDLRGLTLRAVHALSGVLPWRWQRELDPRQLLRNAPELTAKLFVLCGLGALDKHRSTAHVHQVLRPDKAVARNVSNCCVEYWQRTDRKS